MMLYYTLFSQSLMKTVVKRYLFKLQNDKEGEEGAEGLYSLLVEVKVSGSWVSSTILLETLWNCAYHN